MEIVKKVKVNGLDFTVKLHAFRHGNTETYRFTATLFDNVIYNNECYSYKDINEILNTLNTVIRMYRTIDSFEIVEMLFNFMEPGGDIKSDLLSNEHLIKCRINQREKDEEFRSAMQILMYNADVEFSKKPFYSSYGIEKDFHSITDYFNQEAKNFPDKEKRVRAAAPKGAWTSDKMWQAWNDLHRTLDIKMPIEYKSMLSKQKFPKTFRTMDLKTIEAIINNDAVYLSLSQNDREFLTLFRKIAIENELVKPKEEKKGMGGLFQQLSETYINGLAHEPTLFVEDKECADMTIGLYPNEEFKITLNNGREFKVKLAGKEANIKVEQIEDDGSDFDIDKRFHRSRKSTGSPLQMTSKVLRPFIKDFENIVSGTKDVASPLQDLLTAITQTYDKADDYKKDFICNEINTLLSALHTIDNLEHHKNDINKVVDKKRQQGRDTVNRLEDEYFGKDKGRHNFMNEEASLAAMKSEYPVTPKDCNTNRKGNIAMLDKMFAELAIFKSSGLLYHQGKQSIYTSISSYVDENFSKNGDYVLGVMTQFLEMFGQDPRVNFKSLNITDAWSLINYACEKAYLVDKDTVTDFPKETEESIKYNKIVHDINSMFQGFLEMNGYVIKAGNYIWNVQNFLDTVNLFLPMPKISIIEKFLVYLNSFNVTHINPKHTKDVSSLFAYMKIHYAGYDMMAKPSDNIADVNDKQEN